MVDGRLVAHLFRRAGFGLSTAEADRLATVRSYRDLVDSLLVFDPAAVDVDRLIGTPGYVGVTSAGPFMPNSDIGHARQRWLFRLVHAAAPLREKMALIWHHHFATAWSKIRDEYGPADATRLMAAKPAEDPARQRGQVELFRDYALGNFRDLLIEVAKDPAMLVWLDGRTNTRTKPQENFGRELMELFTFGVDHYLETDVYAAARVFSGWNLRTTGPTGRGTASYQFLFRSGEHDTDAKEFTFPIYSRGASQGNRMPSRGGESGIQDGIDLIHALAFHPETARRMARRLWTWFVSETTAPDESFVNAIARVYLDNGTNMRAVLRAVLLSPQFQDPAHFYERYAWPTEFVVRLLREVGSTGFSVSDALTPLVNMGQQLFEPPDVNGWEVGPAWFSTGGMLARMNFASLLATNQRVALREAARPFKATPETMIDFASGALSMPELSPENYGALINYVRSGGTWTGSEAQLLSKSAGLFHLLAGSGEYQFV
jgi:uncharacterized protein (DUF1800 family)